MQFARIFCITEERSMRKLAMYYHAGSKNHGCEAIVRSTAKILNSSLILYSSNLAEDYAYKLDQIVQIKEDVGQSLPKGSIPYFRAAISHKIRKDDYKYITLSHKDFFDQVNKGDIYLSIGGDNYCYKGQDILGYYNREIHKRGAKTVLWGCSVDPADMTDSIRQDLAQYDLIVTREQISYAALKPVNAKTFLLPDPAFQLDCAMLPLPTGFIEGHTVGINLSPLVAEYGNAELIVDNFRKLIEYILTDTNNPIALIPHVVKQNNDDRVILNKLYDEFEASGRVILFNDYNCMQLKGFIARCRFFIGARTHATIAAYSSCVPTLVTGYSVKARGIAQELFGTDKHYVIPVQNFETKNDLTKAFIWLQDHEEDIKNRLIHIMPEYKSRILQARELIEKL